MTAPPSRLSGCCVPHANHGEADGRRYHLIVQRPKRRQDADLHTSGNQSRQAIIEHFNLGWDNGLSALPITGARIDAGELFVGQMIAVKPCLPYAIEPMAFECDNSFARPEQAVTVGRAGVFGGEKSDPRAIARQQVVTKSLSAHRPNDGPVRCREQTRLKSLNARLFADVVEHERMTGVSGARPWRPQTVFRVFGLRRGFAGGKLLPCVDATGGFLRCRAGRRAEPMSLWIPTVSCASRSQAR